MSTVRPATPDDLPEILRLITELAVYEREPDAVEGGVPELAAILFPDEGSPTAFCHVAEVEVGAGEGGGDRAAGDGRGTKVVGIALWYLTFSTWQVRNGIWLEDLYVEEAHRGSGLGVALLRTLADTCVQRGYGRLEWCVLRWNEPSIRFYESVGARPQSEWETYRLTGDALTAFAPAATG